MRKLKSKSEKSISIWNRLFFYRKNMMPNKKSTKMISSNLNLENLPTPAFLISKKDDKFLQSNRHFKEYFSNIPPSHKIPLSKIRSKSPTGSLLEIFSDNKRTGYIINIPKKENSAFNELFTFCFDISPIPKLLINTQGKVIRSNDSFI